MPDRSANPAAERGASAPSRKEKELFLRKWFSDPQTYPDEFKAWLRSSLVADPNITWEVPQIPRLPYSKLVLGGSIVSSDIVDGTITGLDILDGTITNAEVAAAAAILGSKLNWSVGTSPPGSPVAGDIWIYQGSGFYWSFIWDTSEATYKWKFIGGPPLSHDINTSETRTANTYGDLATVGPTVTLPRAGDYDVSWGCNAAGATPTTAYVAIKRGATATADADATLTSTPNNGYWDSLDRQMRITGMAASDVVKLQYRDNSIVLVTYMSRFIKVTPVRVI